MYTLNIDRCTLCNSENTIITDFNSGQVACTNCGAVLDDRIIDETSEWRNFSSENPGSSSSDPNRVGGPINPISMKLIYQQLSPQIKEMEYSQNGNIDHSVVEVGLSIVYSKE